MLIIFLTFPGDMHWKITNSKAKFTHAQKFQARYILYKFCPATKVIFKFFCRNCYKGKTARRKLQKFRSTCMLKNYYFNFRDDRNNKQKTLLHGFTCTTCILNHQNILYHQKPIVCFAFASWFQTNRNFLFSITFLTTIVQWEKKNFLLNFKGMKMKNCYE